MNIVSLIDSLHISKRGILSDRRRTMYTSALVVYDGRANVTLRELNDALAKLHLPAIVYVILSIVIGLIGNTMVIYVYKTKFRRSNHRYFILFVAILDILACMTGMPFLVYSLRFPYLMESVVGCKVLRTFHYFVNNSAGLLLVVISVERFRKICRPFKRQLSQAETLKLCWGTVLFSVFMAAPAGYYFTSTPVDTKVNNITGWECYSKDPGFEYYQLVLMLETLISISIFGVLYGFIIRKVWNNDQFLQAMKNFSWRGRGERSCTENNSYNGKEYSEDMDSCMSRDPHGDSKDSTRPFLTASGKPNNIEEESECRPATGCVGLKPTIVVPEDTIEYRQKPGTGNGAKSSSTDHLELTGSNKNNGGLKVGSKASSSRSLWRLSKELFKRRHSDEDVSKDLKRSVSDATLNRVKQPKKFNTLTPTSRLAISHAIKKNQKRVNRVSTASTAHKNSKTTIRVTVMLFSVSLMFALSFIPHLVLMIITAKSKTFLDSLDRTEIMVYQVFLRIFILNNMVNPIIYIFCDSKFRRECKNVIKCIWRKLCCKSVR